MALVPRKPFWELEKFFEEWPEWPGLELMSTPSRRTPRMNVYEEKGDVVVEAELPGISAEEIDVNIKDNMLTVKAEKREVKEEKEKGYYRREMSRGFYSRAVVLPVEVEGEKAEAKCKNGVLVVRVPKKKEKVREKQGNKIKVEKE